MKLISLGVWLGPCFRASEFPPPQPSELIRGLWFASAFEVVPTTEGFDVPEPVPVSSEPRVSAGGGLTAASMNADTIPAPHLGLRRR